MNTDVGTCFDLMAISCSYSQMMASAVSEVGSRLLYMGKDLRLKRVERLETGWRKINYR